MGAGLTNGNVKTSGSSIPLTDTTENGNSGDTNTARTVNGGAGGTGGTGGTTGTGEKSGQGVPKLVLLEVPTPKGEKKTEDQKKEEKRARDRARYAKNKAEGKTSSTGAKADVMPLDENQLNVIIMTVSAIIGSRPNMTHWALSVEEVNSITRPLSSMIAKSESLGNMGEYADQIALIIACGTILIPRVLTTLEKRKEVKENVNRPKLVADSGKSAEQQSGQVEKTSQRTNVNPSRPSTPTNKDIFNLLPANA